MLLWTLNRTSTIIPIEMCVPHEYISLSELKGSKTA